MACIICLSGCGATIYLLAELNHNYSLMGFRTTFPCSLFLLLWVSSTSFSHSIEGNILLCCFAIEIFSLFGCYQQPLSIGQTFLLFLTVGTGSIISCEHIIYVPIYYTLLAFLQGLSIRSFFAGLAGLIFPYWWLFACLFFTDNMNIFPQFNIQPELLSEGVHVSFLPMEWTLSGYIALLFICGSIYLLKNDFQNKLRTRAYLHALLIWTCYSAAILFLFPNKSEAHLPAIFLGTSIIGGHMFSLSSNKFSNWCFLSALLALILISVFNVWKPQCLFS